jgi:hypothetical protein
MKTRTLALLLVAAACTHDNRIAGPVAEPRADQATALATARPSFTYHALAALGDPAPGGGTFINDFEPYGLSDHGEVAFVADIAQGEGVFLDRAGQLTAIARSGTAAPGAGVFAPADLGTTALNEAGDVAFVFTLEPLGAPLGMNAGLYRYSSSTGVVTPLVLPGNRFAGVFFDPSLNRLGTIAFTGVLPGDNNRGVFTMDRAGNITDVASPGDPAPGGTFLRAQLGVLNDGGDVAFEARLVDESALSIYLKHAATGEIQSVVHAGDPAPGGGIFLDARGPILNDRDDIAFAGHVTDATWGVFVWSAGTVVPVAQPGNAMPGGGILVTAPDAGSTERLHLNGAGAIAFFGQLVDGTIGLYLWSNGTLRLVARTGTVLPGIGTIESQSVGGGTLNELGQVLFATKVIDATGQERTVLLVATPSPSL